MKKKQTIEEKINQIEQAPYDKWPSLCAYKKIDIWFLIKKHNLSVYYHKWRVYNKSCYFCNTPFIITAKKGVLQVKRSCRCFRNDCSFKCEIGLVKKYET